MRIDKICKTCGFDSNGVCGMYTTHARKAKSAMTGKLLWSIIPRLRKKHLGILRNLMINVK